VTPGSTILTGITLGVLSVPPYLIFAQVENLGAEWANLTALGIVGVVVIFLTTKMLPDLHKKFVEQSVIFSETVKEIQQSFSSAADKSQVAFLGSIDKILERTERWEIQRHDDVVQLTKAVALLTTQCATHVSSLVGFSRQNVPQGAG
jgi:hypothetical protein